MTAKEYLEQIKTLDKCIEIKADELSRLWSRATSTTSAADKEPGGSSGISDKVGNTVAKIIDKRIREELARLKDERQKRIDLIMTVQNPLHLTVLYKFYVNHISLVDIADEEGYSYDYIAEIRCKATKNLKI